MLVRIVNTNDAIYTMCIIIVVNYNATVVCKRVKTGELTSGKFSMSGRHFLCLQMRAFSKQNKGLCFYSARGV